MNDWKLTAALKAVFIVLLAVWALVGLDELGVHLPLLRGIFSVAYLLFIPGMLILRALRAHRFDSERTVLFAVGLSIATIMFTGLFMNFVYPLLGIARPFTLVPAIGTMSAVTILLAALSYWRDRDFVDDATLNSNRVLKPPFLLLCLIPFIMIFAVYAMNAYQTNLILLGALVVIGATAFWVCTSSSFPKGAYPLAVFVIALAMLYFGSLVSPYVWGWDIQQELFHANLVLANGVWNASLPGSTNSVISITLLAPFLSLTSGASVTWLFKIVYPLVFALVPLGVFVAVRSQTSDRIAFLAAFFISSLFTFFGEMPALARQEVAELFLVLLLVLLVDKYRSRDDKRRVYALCAIFAASLVVSHYALALIYLAYVVIAWLLLFVVDNPALHRLQRSARDQPTRSSLKPRRMLTLIFILSFAAFSAAWFVSLGSSASAPIGVTLGRILNIFSPRALAIGIGVGVVAYVGALVVVYVVAARKTTTWPWMHAAAPLVLFAGLSATRVLYSGASLNDVLQIGTLSPLHEIGLFLYLLSVFLIAVGLGTLALRRCRRGFDSEFVALALASFAIFISATIVPQLAFSINATRLFHISTLLLAPFCVTGGVFVGQSIAHVIVRSREVAERAFAFKLVAAFFVILFLFSSGFVYEVTHQESASFILNSNVDAPRFNGRELIAAQWLGQVRGSDPAGHSLLPIYADVHRRVIFDGIDLYHTAVEFPNPPTSTPPNAYVFLGTFNIERAQTAMVSSSTVLQGMTISYVDLGNKTDGRGKIFDDGGAAIYYRRTN